MRKVISSLPAVVALLGCLTLAACGGDDSDTEGGSGATGTGGTAGEAGSSGSSGTAGTGGTAGASGKGGAAGSAGTAGSSGASGNAGAGGASGTGGEAGTAGQAGAGGEAGTAGAGGSSGAGGEAGSAGSAGSSGAGGTAGAGGTGGTGGSGPTEVICQTLPAGACSITPGDGGRVITGTVLAPDKLYRGGQVVLNASGSIVFVGCKADCDNDATCKAAAASATAITCPSGVVSPGLINTHDHITYTNTAPGADSGERYEHRHEWRKGSCGHTKLPVPGGATSDQILWGELRFLFGGATSTIGSGGVAGLLRNLDKTTQEGLNQTPADFDTFPLNDSTPPSGMCSGPVACSTYSGVVTETSIAGDDSYLPHVSEGINAFAENEFVCLGPANPGHNVLQAKSAYIHGIGLKAVDYAAMAQAHTSLIWSPRSNVSLYGDTAIVTEAARMGVRIALGTDWLASGSMNVLRELRCADSLNQTYFGKFFSDYDLWMMTTGNAAAATAVDDVIGRLEKGKVGDVSIFDGTTHKDYRAIIDAEPKDVQLVLRAGKALYGDQALIQGIPNVGSCDAVDVCSSAKRVCLQDEIGKSYSALEASANIYPAFFCSAPTNEPSCKPVRPNSVNGSTIYTGDPSSSDADGDGIADATDNCKNTFNPIRPMDSGKQADADGDGAGDACDPCPLDANTTVCTSFNPNDSDGDTIDNAVDNCPTLANTDQKDTDQDGKGDVCDACPNAANPGDAACPARIYEIKNGTIPAGNTVALTGQLVTGRYAKGYYLQVKPGDADWDATLGASYSGIYVYDTTNTFNVGDRINITKATITDFYGQIELTTPTAAVVTSLGEASPAPVVATPAEVATGGAKAAALESVIVEVDDVSVTNIAPPVGSGDSAPTNEFVVGGSLRVNDVLYLIAPFPSVGQQYAALRGILDYRNNDSKLELRSAADVVMGSATLVGFSPALSFVNLGDVGTTTFPTPLVVTLSNAAASDVFVSVASADPASLSVVGNGVTVPAGQMSAPVMVDGILQTAQLRLTATLGVTSLDSYVRVIADTDTRSITSLNPASVTLQTGATQQFTVALDIPAPSGGMLVTLLHNGAGTMPAQLVVPFKELSATFDYVAPGVDGIENLTAQLGLSQSIAEVTISGNACSTNHLVISEIRSRGAGGANDEFVELYNPTSSPVTLDSTWKIEGRSNATGSFSARWAGSGKVIPAHGHFLVAYTGYTQQPAADAALTSGITDATAVRLVQSGTTVDIVCYGFDAASTAVFSSDATYGCEGTPVTTNPHNNATSTNADASIERKPGGASGNCTDTGNNAADFLVSTPANPQSTASAPTP